LPVVIGSQLRRQNFFYLYINVHIRIFFDMDLVQYRSFFIRR
jgi:hypothetical protein